LFLYKNTDQISSCGRLHSVSPHVTGIHSDPCKTPEPEPADSIDNAAIAGTFEQDHEIQPADCEMSQRDNNPLAHFLENSPWPNTEEAADRLKLQFGKMSKTASLTARSINSLKSSARMLAGKQKMPVKVGRTKTVNDACTLFTIICKECKKSILCLRTVKDGLSLACSTCNHEEQVPNTF
jgi:hypothetical protein